MIYKLITEMDSMSHHLHNDDNSRHSAGEQLSINYGRIGDPAIIGAYVYFFYGYDVLSADERDAIRGIYVTDERNGRIKLFPKGYKNMQVSGALQDIVKTQIEKDFIAYINTIGHKGFAPLMIFSLETRHGRARNDFVQVLRECGFNIPGNKFLSRTNILLCRENYSEICILPNDQLMTIIDKNGELTAYLADCHLIHATTGLLRQPPMDNPPREYANVEFCNLDILRDAWNEYARTL